VLDIGVMALLRMSLVKLICFERDFECLRLFGERELFRYHFAEAKPSSFYKGRKEELISIIWD
jgi:hypothetical protein